MEADALIGTARELCADTLAAEGILSRRRQSVVRASTLASAARRLGLGEAIRALLPAESQAMRDEVG